MAKLVLVCDLMVLVTVTLADSSYSDQWNSSGHDYYSVHNGQSGGSSPGGHDGLTGSVYANQSTSGQSSPSGSDDIGQGAQSGNGGPSHHSRTNLSNEYDSSQGLTNQGSNKTGQELGSTDSGYQNGYVSSELEHSNPGDEYDYAYP